MKIKNLLLAIVFLGLSLTESFAGNGNVIWNGTGDATQSVSLIQSKGKTKVFYYFKNVRFVTMVDSGSFTIANQKELNLLIEDLKGAITKSGEESSFEWSRGKYTIKSGGNNSPKKGTFKIWIGEKHCPMNKKNAQKLIKALTGVVDDLEEGK